MTIITEDTILEAYDSNELNEIDLIELYEEGYISDNTMNYLIESGMFDEYLTEITKDDIKLKARNALLTGAFHGVYKPFKTALHLKNNIKAHGFTKGVKKVIQDHAIEKMALDKYKKIPGNDDKKYINYMYVGKNGNNAAVKKIQDYKKKYDYNIIGHTVDHNGKTITDKNQVDKINAKKNKLSKDVRYATNVVDRLKKIKGIKDPFFN